MKATNFNKPTKEQLTAAFAHAWGDDKHMTDYCVKKTDTAVILSNGAIFTIDKREINTRFCFGYSTCGQGAEYEEAESTERRAAKSVDYFRAKKDIMRRLADEIARMMIIAPSVFPSESLEKNRIISNIKRGEKHLQAGKEFYFANIGDQVLMATETRI